jgi:hypothetical protein
MYQWGEEIFHQCIDEGRKCWSIDVWAREVNLPPVYWRRKKILEHRHIDEDGESSAGVWNIDIYKTLKHLKHESNANYSTLLIPSINDLNSYYIFMGNEIFILKGLYEL